GSNLDSRGHTAQRDPRHIPATAHGGQKLTYRVTATPNRYRKATLPGHPAPPPCWRDAEAGITGYHATHMPAWGCRLARTACPPPAMPSGSPCPYSGAPVSSRRLSGRQPTSVA